MCIGLLSQSRMDTMFFDGVMFFYYLFLFLFMSRYCLCQANGLGIVMLWLDHMLTHLLP